MPTTFRRMLPSPQSSFQTSLFADYLYAAFVNCKCPPAQAFQNFVDARIQPEADDLDIRFFDASITAKRNRSMLHVIKKDANFLRCCPCSCCCYSRQSPSRVACLLHSSTHSWLTLVEWRGWRRSCTSRKHYLHATFTITRMYQNDGTGSPGDDC